MTTILKKFQCQMRDALVTRFKHLKAQYDALSGLPDRAETLTQIRLNQGAVMLQAPTGVGKTLIAVDTVQSFSTNEKVVWFWFVPFVGLVGQAQRTFQAEAPAVKLLSLESDRFTESLRPGGVYALSWQSVASTLARRVLRETRDDGLSVDDLILQARELGYRIGCVVDEAHHGLHKAQEASTFFSTILKPDYALLMTATPRDEDAIKFSQKTGYKLGNPDEWATITREQGVEAGLLKAGVKTVKFIARSGNESKMLDFERIALAQAASMHRRIKLELEQLGVGVAPLLLVQVPNGGESVDDVERVLVSELGFPAGSVRKHTSDEPDNNLAAVANDPSAEVLIFKMAIAMGFDAPRAFTLAALRGVRDREFGTQVVGRIMRVHRLLQGREDVPELLKNGYVFLANQEDQEGLRGAAGLINAMRAQEPQLGQQTILTLEVGADSSDVTLVNSQGESETVLAATSDGEASLATVTPPQQRGSTGLSNVSAEVLETARNLVAQLQGRGQLDLLNISGGVSAGAAASGSAPPATPPAASATLADVIAATAVAKKRYLRKADAPLTLKTELLPSMPDNFEEQVVGLVDFTRVLGDRDRTGTQLTQRTEDLFTEEESMLDESILAQLSPSVIAERAKQVALPFRDVDERDFLNRLEDRFRDALVRQGIAVPADAEVIRRQLDLVLVRNPKLVREAHKRVRASLVEVRDVTVPDALIEAAGLPRSARNIYGVFPPGLNKDEREFANLLDTDDEVIWWHRNPSDKPGSVALWAWSGGVTGFYPDFVVAVKGRAHAAGQALVEVKGEFLQEWEKAKAGAKGQHHGRAFMVGKRGDDGNFYFFRLENHQLELDGLYESQRLKLNI
ncbi:DEAD/DEAH box helicase family protein [Aquabacterium sp.]|uniref:DEAD/DEAH box helicase n=1 Tax=Aquabacterium sp. TaxID=1872578 RepID=UPI002488C711|nr:DEAD/DEAH box helicase family protein [Aquabacterium sp.]MDI1258299.1 DEAD/DEAH box helicase family protein [Aquabacterium sp.]